MSYSVVTIPPFDKQLKRLVKKFPSLKVDVVRGAALAKLAQKLPSGIHMVSYRVADF